MKIGHFKKGISGWLGNDANMTQNSNFKLNFSKRDQDAVTSFYFNLVWFKNSEVMI